MARLIDGVVLAVVLFSGTAAVAQHSDITLEVTDNRLVTFNDLSGLASRVFTGTLGELSVPGYTDDPGFRSEQLAPGSLVGFDVTTGLWFWDGSVLTETPEDETLQILINGSAVMTVSSADGSQDGPNFAQASGAGAIHQHIQYWVQHPSFDPGAPFVNPISEGAYVLFMQITSSVHETSEEFAIVFNHGLSQEDLQVAVDAVNDFFEPPCPGDLDVSGAVDLGDLAVGLSNYGIGSGATPEQGDLDGDGDVDLADLATLLAGFGSDC